MASAGAAAGLAVAITRRRTIRDRLLLSPREAEVLRLVATNRKFIRSYSVVRNLLNNPRAPVDVILPFVNRLNDRDLKELSRNKNVAEVIRRMANKLVKQKEQANKPKFPGKH